MLVFIKKKYNKPINMYTKLHHFLKNFAPYVCSYIAQFLYKASHFFIQNAITCFPKFHRELSTYPTTIVQLYNYNV